jgi:hypothetical protein
VYFLYQGSLDFRVIRDAHSFSLPQIKEVIIDVISGVRVAGGYVSKADQKRAKVFIIRELGTDGVKEGLADSGERLGYSG